jgi:hypothetical protein
MFPDPFDRTVRLQVKITDGRLALIDGSNLPPLKKDIEAELIVSANAITDEQARAKFTNERKVRFLPKGTTLYARIQVDGIPASLQKSAEPFKIHPNSRGKFVPFELVDLLWLTLRSGKRAQLDDCSIKVPALTADAGSVNEAYTKISVAFEPTRRSHTGNVFKRVFAERDDGSLEPLDLLRAEIEATPPAPEQPHLSTNSCQ